MRWWLRVLVTVVLGPPVWWVLSGYVATQQGASFDQWLHVTPRVVTEAYVAYTLPALLLCAVLIGLDGLLNLASLDLFTVLLSPIAATALAWAAVHFIPEPHVRAAGASLPLFAIYGLVWGLTVREPRHRLSTVGRTDGDFVDALLPRR